MKTPIKTTFIGRDVKENELPKTYQDELCFYGCFFDGHWLAELNCKQITFVGCYFAGEAELSKSTFETVSFKNCFFCEPLEIHIGSHVSHWQDIIKIYDDSDCDISVYQNNKRIAEKTINVLPRQFQEFVSLRHFDTDLVYDQLKEIHHHYSDQKNIDCIPIFSGIVTDAGEIVQADTLRYLLDHGKTSEWHTYIMQVVFNWVFAPYLISDISFVRNIKPSDKWHVPSFSRIFSESWFNITEGLESIIRCIQHNPALLEDAFYDRVKYLALHHDKTSVVSYCIDILLFRKEYKLLKTVIETRSELIQTLENPEVLALTDMIPMNPK